MATHINPKVLLQALAADPAIQAIQAESPSGLDVPALLAALASVESNYRLDAVAKTKTEASYGLWQINSKVWPHVTDAIIGNLDAQIDAVIPVLQQANAVVEWALSNRAARRAGGEVFKPPAGVGDDLLPVWYSIIWQYGAGSLAPEYLGRSFGFKNWIATTTDHTAAGFHSWRLSVKRAPHVLYDRRQKQVVEEYKKKLLMQLDDSSFWRDVVGQTGKDALELPSKAKLPGWAYLGLIVGGLYLLQPLFRTGEIVARRAAG